MSVIKNLQRIATVSCYKSNHSYPKFERIIRRQYSQLMETHANATLKTTSNFKTTKFHKRNDH